MKKIIKFNKRRAFNKNVGPGKNPKLINVVPTYYRVDVLLCLFWTLDYSFSCKTL